MGPQLFRNRVVEYILRLIHRDTDSKALEAARQRDAEEVGKRADRGRERQPEPPADETPAGG